MKTIIISDLTSYGKNWRFFLMVVLLVVFGFLAGSNARFGLSDDLAYNSPYQIAYITAFLSLTVLFFSTIFTAQLALKEMDYNFNLIYFSLPISKQQFLLSRFISVYALSFFATFILSVSFFLGREMESEATFFVKFNFFYYFLPLFIFTAVNSLFVVAITTFVAWFSKSKLMIYTSGLLLYIFYMVTLLFSGSPFMANQLPQSEQAKWISAIFDPFGLSSFFYQTTKLTINEKNTNFLNFNGILLANRIGVIIIAFLLLFIITKKFTIFRKFKRTRIMKEVNETHISLPFHFIKTHENSNVKWQSFLSFLKINSIYVVKSIPFVLLMVILLFAVGMEMYAEIEKGIRLPQKYATTGLMVSAIIQNFYVLGAVTMVFYANDLYWRSKSSNFHLIEESTSNSRLKFWSIWFVLIGIAIAFTVVLVLEGIVFQFFYDYPKIELDIYGKTFLFTTLPLVLVGGLALFFQKLFKNKYVSLAVSGTIILLFTTSLGKVLIKNPLLKFLYSINFDYSDMNGFGAYENAFVMRLAFGFIIIFLLLFLIYQTKKSKIKVTFWMVTFVLFSVAIYLGTNVISGYIPKNKEDEQSQLIHYEKQFRRFQNMPQPTITKVNSKVNLFPSENRYNIKGNYILENKTNAPITEILFNFSDNFTILKAELAHKNQKKSVSNQFQIIKLKEPLLPAQKSTFEFEISYQWKPVNGHQSMNAIVENGAFMRISRYFPQIGYQIDNETQDEAVRKNNGLGKVTTIKSFDAPKVPNNDFISLDMIISTEAEQTVIGIGELQKQWKQSNRTFFHYKAENIPFRFAVSSAKYAVKKEIYKGKLFEVYYHPAHFENVKHLIENAKITMDYCETYFGKYPFKMIRFAEISSFTKGFNATAYPATIFMTENMAFHCDIKADKKQDVINELAGHELSHLWWGNNQISPDEREGGAMLTETLAMYTELMLLKKMYGKKKAEENVKIHQNIYESEKGFSGNQPLIKMTSDNIHISYSKGAVAMYELSELIGEDKVNLALKNFLNKNKFPNLKPVSIDFLNEVYRVSDNKFHKKIKQLFEE